MDLENDGEEIVVTTKLDPTCSLDIVKDERESSVPDGGWGWVVVLATLTFNIIYDGCSYSFGILYMDLLDHFGDTKSNTAWIGSLFFAVPLLCAPFAGMITMKLGSRTATMLGGLIASVGFAIGSFSSSIWMLVICYGLIGGIGMSLPYFNSLKTVTDYFDKRLALASGIAESGAGLGTVIFAPFTEFLVTNFGWRGTILILSGVVANIIVCGALYRPLDRRDKVVEIELIKQCSSEEEETFINAAEMKNDIDFKPGTNSSRLSEENGSILSDKNHTSKIKSFCQSHSSRMFSIPFIIFVISNFVMYFWYDIPYVFLVDRSVSFGMSSQKASYLLSIIGFVHLFSIIGYGLLGDRKFVNRAVLYGLSTALCGVSVLLVPFFKQFPILAILSGCFGLFSAATEALLSCVLIDIVGKKAFDTFFCGFILFMEGVANLVGPPFAGFLSDVTGNYDAAFYVAGACITSAGVLYVTLSKVRINSEKEKI
ncbi:monocarboxylate transporter 12-like [Mercenaria mercenaria]|uniref:monocarboxylate transporter 12-like n=1 Tax=Mercenaria mercenaria TaxID=6596 RepID=UPI00234F23E7|nr:monocarboxylate transporter 12-like [Mercenaria mercenaria]XP_053391729.1 monocarboxylate transporter 12-like [Mercenaria mercenaria]XP_053391735.1 monocarboxylate transporter 12-like [Mercenaria mercenaria]